MRAPARPSHNAGHRFGHPLASTWRAAASTRSGDRPTTWLVPSVTVTGRSVFSRKVRHGTPRTVVSSWMPPESVRTSAAPCSRAVSYTHLRAHETVLDLV